MKKLIHIFFFGIALSMPNFAQVIILDFEDPATSTNFQYFGSTLEGALNNIIANPDPTGLNESANVADWVKPMDAQTWAGGFANPGVSPIDLTSNSEICVMVWFNQPGNLALKLENGDRPNWIIQEEVSDTMQWVEVCFNTNLPSIEDPFESAFGGTYPGLVLFFDFGISPTADRNYFFDNMIAREGTAPTPIDVEFAVDMNGYTDSIGGVFVSGTFNNWSENANPLSDADMDGIWTGTVVDIIPGAVEYKFQVNEWMDEEVFEGFASCTITDESGMFTNRRLTESMDATLDTVCWNSCFACGEGVRLTVNLGQGVQSVSAEGLYIAGGGNFGNPGDFRLSDDDMDGIHTATFELPRGFSSFYTFTNGACGDFSCKENIAGLPCSDPANYDDRFMGPLTQDTIISTCFGECTDDAVSCQSETRLVTFEVDMNGNLNAFTAVFLSGTFNTWSADADPMTDMGNGIWSIQKSLAPGSYEFKFQTDGWADEEMFMIGDPCTITDPSQTFTNRELIIDADDIEICALWNSCEACPPSGVNDLNSVDNLFTIRPSITNAVTWLHLHDSTADVITIFVFDTYGKIILEKIINNNTDIYQLDLSNSPNGLYFVTVQSKLFQQTEKIINRI